VLWTYALHRRFERINNQEQQQQGTKKRSLTVTAFDPGLMPGTGLAREASSVERLMWKCVMPNIQPLLRVVISHNIHTPQESGAALARLAIGEDVKGESGVYYEGLKQIKSSKDSYDEAKQEELWSWTIKTIARDEEEKRKFELVS
jgi:hypothetical protein